MAGLTIVRGSLKGAGDRLKGERRSQRGREKERVLGLFRKSVLKELVFFLPWTNSQIYCVSTEVNSPL